MKKTAIVTGSSRGIGFAIARQLGLDGYNKMCIRDRAVVMAAAGLWFREPLLRGLFGGVEEEVMRQALAYFTIISFSFPSVSYTHLDVYKRQH